MSPGAADGVAAGTAANAAGAPEEPEEAWLESLGDESGEELGTDRRPWCGRCGRARSTCICSSLPAGAPLETRTRVVLLIHPKEEQRRLGTAPLLQICLRNILVRVAGRFPEPEEDAALHAALAAGGRRCMLVCPGPEAEELVAPRAAAGQASADPPPTTLIFIDGRWPQAKAMVNRSPWLQRLPRAILRPAEQSGYCFRQQPAEGCLSTLEAVAEALVALEGPRGPALKAALVAPFRRMVALQCGYLPGSCDKNAELSQGAAPARLFDASALEGGGGGVQGPDGSVHCVVRWGGRAVEGRVVVVVEVVRGQQAEAKRRARELSCGKAHGQRCWVLPLGKVPPGARQEG